MILNTRGIVLHQIKYSETSLICKIYTEKAGLQTFIIPGARRKNAPVKASQLQHLNLVDLVTDQRPNREMHYLKSVKVTFPFKSIPFDIIKSSIAVFINEVLLKVVKEEEANPSLFEFLFQCICLLDTEEDQLSTFHHVFLLKLSQYLGFYPQNNFSDFNPNFHMEEGAFTDFPCISKLIIEPPLSSLLSRLMQSDLHHREALAGSSQSRNLLLVLLLDYYKIHLPGLGEFKSHLVLSEVFDS